MKVDVTVPGKRGPFMLRKLRTTELMEFTQLMSSGNMAAQCLYIVAATLVNGKGDPVFESQEEADATLGGVAIMDLGLKGFKYNQIGKLANFDKHLADALKN